MIRFLLGLLMVYIGVGSIEDPSAPLNEGIAISAVGLALMLWALPTVRGKDF